MSANDALRDAVVLLPPQEITPLSHYQIALEYFIQYILQQSTAAATAATIKSASDGGQQVRRAAHVTLALCFRYCSLESLVSVRRVCRLWSAAVSDPVSQRTHVVVLTGRSRFVDNSILENIARTMKYLTRLSVDDCQVLTHSAIRHIGALTHLTHLSIRRCNRALNDQSILFLLNCKRLTQLDMTAATISDQAILYLSALTQITHLSLANCSKLTSQTLFHLQHMTSLLKLDLSNCHAIHSKGYVYLAQLVQLNDLNLDGLPIHPADMRYLNTLPLRRLDVSFCSDVDDNAMTHLSSTSMSTLKVVSLHSCPQLTDGALQTLASSIVSLDLTRGVQMTDNAMLILSRQCLRLQSLRINECSQITDVGIRHLSCALKKLHSFSAAFCTKLTDMSLRYFNDGRIPLLTLNMMECPLITDAGMSHFITRNQRLILLNVCGCRFISDETIRACIRIKSLKRLNARFCHLIGPTVKRQFLSNRKDCILTTSCK